MARRCFFFFLLHKQGSANPIVTGSGRNRKNSSRRIQYVFNGN